MTSFGREMFIEVNAAFLALTGYEHAEVVGRSSRELAMWSSPEDQKKLGEAQRHGRGFRNLDLKLRTKEGNLRDILISAEVIRLDGHDGFLKMFYDVTDQRRTQEQMHQAISEVMSETHWFSHKVMERLAHIKTGSTEALELVELSKREREVLERLAKGRVMACQGLLSCHSLPRTPFPLIVWSRVGKDGRSGKMVGYLMGMSAILPL